MPRTWKERDKMGSYPSEEFFDINKLVEFRKEVIKHVLAKEEEERKLEGVLNSNQQRFFDRLKRIKNDDDALKRIPAYFDLPLPPERKHFDYLEAFRDNEVSFSQKTKGQSFQDMLNTINTDRGRVSLPASRKKDLAMNDIKNATEANNLSLIHI